jgi:DNA-binding NarL/FixJ family response regulator
MVPNQTGNHVRVNSYQGNGFTEGTMSTFQPGSEARKFEAVRLRENGLTQQEIANRLNLSQKTISNDLK